MKTPAWICLFLLSPVSCALAGSIAGTVTAKGPVVAGAASGDDAYAGSMRYNFAEKVDYNRLQDFVVYVDQELPDAPGAADLPTGTVTQKDVGFEPHVLPIVRHSRVRWPNKDVIFHNVFSMSETEQFDLGLYTNEKVPEITFDKLGQVDVYCSIHSKMHCIVLVLPNRHFAKVNAGQRYELKDLPAGTYRVKVWQERVPAQVREITVPAQGTVKADFTLGFSGQAK